MLTVKVSKAWVPHILGALSLLSRNANWDTDDDALLTTTQYRVNDLLNLFLNPIGSPPFYDGEQDVDEVTDAEYPWYEKVSDWVITAFLAVTTTPGAAIVYKTTIPQIRLAFRTGDLGAIVRVLLDDLEIWTGDTNAPVQGLLEANLDLEAFAAEHTLGGPPYEFKIVHAGAPAGLVARLTDDTPLKMEVELGDIRPRTAQMELRQSGCVIQVSTNGVDWTTLYDPTSCIQGWVDSGINDRLNDGTLGRPFGQLGPASPPAAGECQIYYVTLDGNSQWHLPSPLNYGDTLTVRNLTGGWSDGSVNWFCPDGSTYAFGECQPGGQSHETGDVLNPGAYHMALVMKAGETWFPAPVSGFTNTAGTTAIDVIFQANDGSLNDNTGSITFEVEVCSFAGWTHTFDFTTSDQAWELDSYLGWGGVYVAATGWETTTGSGNDAMSIKYTFAETVTITRVVIDRYRHVPSQNGSSYGSGGIMFDHAAYIVLEGPAGRQNVEWQGSAQCSVLTYYDSDYLYPGTAGWCYTVTVAGTGPDPFV